MSQFCKSYFANKIRHTQLGADSEECRTQFGTAENTTNKTYMEVQHTFTAGVMQDFLFLEYTNDVLKCC